MHDYKCKPTKSSWRTSCVTKLGVHLQRFTEMQRVYVELMYWSLSYTKQIKKRRARYKIIILWTWVDLVQTCQSFVVALTLEHAGARYCQWPVTMTTINHVTLPSGSRGTALPMGVSGGAWSSGIPRVWHEAMFLRLAVRCPPAMAINQLVVFPLWDIITIVWIYHIMGNALYAAHMFIGYYWVQSH